MKRSILLALFAALALAVGVSSVAVAGDGTAHAAKKGKGCKGKKGKASAVASAKKGKGKGCKKGKGSKPAARLTDGTYDGQDGVGLIVKGGGTQAALKFVGGDDKTCVPLPIETDATSVSSTRGSFTASGESSGSLELKWSITVTPDLKYNLVLDSSYAFADENPCDKPGVKFSGTLTKAG